MASAGRGIHAARGAGCAATSPGWCTARFDHFAVCPELGGPGEPHPAPPGCWVRWASVDTRWLRLPSNRKIKSTGTAKVLRSCSDVFRLWMSVGLGVLVALVFEIIVIALQVTRARPAPTDAQFELEFGFGGRLAAWNAFAVSCLALGLRAFSHCDRAELVRRVLASLSRHPVSKGGCWLGEAVPAGQSSSHSSRSGRSSPQYSVVRTPPDSYWRLQLAPWRLAGW